MRSVCLVQTDPETGDTDTLALLSLAPIRAIIIFFFFSYTKSHSFSCSKTISASVAESVDALVYLYVPLVPSDDDGGGGN